MKLDKQSHLATRLLSGSRKLSVPEKDEMLKTVLGGVRKEQRFGKRRVVAGAISFAATALLVCLILSVWSRSPSGNENRFDAASEFTARGNGEEVSFLAARCSDGNRNQCVLGGKMAYKTRAPHNKPYLAAFMRHQSTGTVIWLFPNNHNGRSIRVPVSVDSELMSQGTLLDSAYPPGEYILYGVFSDTPYSKDKIKTFFDNGQEDTTHVVITESIVNIEDYP